MQCNVPKIFSFLPTMFTRRRVLGCQFSLRYDGHAATQERQHEEYPCCESVHGCRGAAPSCGWVAGRLWKPPPLAGWLAGWLARPRKTAKIRSAPLYRLFSRMVWVWGWVCKGGGGSATFQEHPYLILQVALPSEAPIKSLRWPLAPANTFLRVTFCARTRWRWPLAPADTFLHKT